MVCYIQKYVIILAGIFPLTSPPTKILGGGCVPGIPGGVDASGRDKYPRLTVAQRMARRQSAAQDSRVVDDSSVERRQLVEVGGAAEPTRREERVVLGDLLYVL